MCGTLGHTVAKGRAAKRQRKEERLDLTACACLGAYNNSPERVIGSNVIRKVLANFLFNSKV